MGYRNLGGRARTIAAAAITAILTSQLLGCALFKTDETQESVLMIDDHASEHVDAEGTLNASSGFNSMMYDVAPEEDFVDFNTEEYDSLDEQGFIAAATRPLSTLSADVDTASYCNLRRMLRDGYTMAESTNDEESGEDDPEQDEWYYYENSEIPTGAVRIEEMLNYFDYDYAMPEGDDLFGVTTHVGDCPWNNQTKLVTLGFATAPEATSIAKKGSNLVFLIDVSGSMDDPDKLGLLKNAFGELVHHLGENDRVSVVTYAGGGDVVLEGAKGNEERKIMRAINQLRAGGSTNGEAGLKTAYEIAKDNYIEGGVNRIVMASDGDLNVGMSSESELHDYVDKQRETGIYLSVLGFGSGNYKDNKMETLADHGNGSYHYIDCIEEAERVLGTKLTANLVPLADDVKVQVEFNPAQVKGYRLIGYENRAMADEDFRDDKKDAGDVGPGHQFTVAYEVALTDSKQEINETDLKYDEKTTEDTASDEWLTATVRYKPATGGKVREQTSVVSASDASQGLNEDGRFQAAVIELGMLLRNSDYAGTSSRDQIDELLKGIDLTEEQKGFLELVDLALGRSWFPLNLR